MAPEDGGKHPKIVKLWVYPVKGCQGTSLNEARLTPTGLQYDRNWCIVDVHGIAASKLEAISMRKVPSIGRIHVRLQANTLELSAPDTTMPTLQVPVDVESYADNEDVLVECAGKSTTTGKGWSLGFVAGKSAGEAASAWLGGYLNASAGSNGTRVSGKKQESRFLLVRSVASLKLEEYPPIFPIIAKSKSDGEYRTRFEKNQKAFADFAPLLVCNEASRLELVKQGNFKDYPIESFRPSILVDAPGRPFDEENWEEVDIYCDGRPLRLQLIKPCPRCTVTCRDPKTTKFLFPKEKVKLWKVLRRMFPEKQADEEWGSWAGPWFGCYFGNAGQSGVVKVGTRVELVKHTPWQNSLGSKTSTLLQRVRFFAERNATTKALAIMVLLMGLFVSRRARMPT